MNAVCFKCGGEKVEPMKMCGKCHALPESRSDKVISMGLSTRCIKPENVVIAGKYIRKKGRPPKLHSKVHERAVKLVKQFRFPEDVSKSIELSASFFNFDDLIVDDQLPPISETIVAHSIGKTKSGEFEAFSTSPTYQKISWSVGVDISESDFKKFADNNGEIHVWYRWIDEAWQQKLVSKEEFEQLQELSK